jgi:predicted neuraminidase/quercetin dioxygenase-like cupin family protein
MIHTTLARLALVVCLAAAATAVPAAEESLPLMDQPGMVLAEFVYDDVSFPQCHASTIADTPAGLVAAWFGGTHEKHEDVGIWVARHVDGKWTDPVEVANGAWDDGKRYPCWNPVLFQMAEGPLLLFYKVGPDPRTWWGMVTMSRDRGNQWSEPRKLPEGYAGPIKNKPVTIGDTLVCGSSTEDNGWRVHMELVSDRGREHKKTGPLNDGETLGAIQPTILVHPNNVLQILCRTRQKKISECWSNDGGLTWSEMKLNELPNPNSGIDAVTLADGRHLLVYNHTPKGRSPLNVAVSDDGVNWQAALVLESEPGEYSYPAVVQSADGLVHITYTWKRSEVKHVVVDPARLQLRPIVDGNWPDLLLPTLPAGTARPVDPKPATPASENRDLPGALTTFGNLDVVEYDWGWIRWMINGKLDPEAEMTLGMVYIKPNQTNPAHIHPNSAEFLHVLEGSCEHMVGKKWVALQKGDTLRIPKDVPHKARTGQEACKAIIVYDTGDRQFVEVNE